jgi:hypothetical protein
MPVELFWKRTSDLVLAPELMVRYKEGREGNGVLMEAQCSPEVRPPVQLLVYKERHWLDRFFHEPSGHGILTRKGTPIRAIDNTTWSVFVTRRPFLPSPERVPGQTRWRFRHPEVAKESGPLTVTALGCVIEKSKVDLEFDPRVNVEMAELADAKVSIGHAGRAKTTTKISALVDPSLQFDLILPWQQEGAILLSEVVQEYARENIVGTWYEEWASEKVKAEVNELYALVPERMREFGLIAEHPKGWQFTLEPTHTELSEDESTEITLTAVASEPGRVLAAIRVNDLTAGRSAISDLVEFERG